MFLGHEYVVNFVNRGMNLSSIFSLNCNDFHRLRVTVVITESTDAVFSDLLSDRIHQRA